jgi:membrane-bound lytic murein transglycosylase B
MLRVTFRRGTAGALCVALLGACAPEASLPPPLPPQSATAPSTPTARTEAPTPVALGCGETEEGFDAWLAAFRVHAEANGIAPEIVIRALADVSYDANVVALDRSQGDASAKEEIFLDGRRRTGLTSTSLLRGLRLPARSRLDGLLSQAAVAFYQSTPLISWPELMAGRGPWVAWTTLTHEEAPCRDSN